MERTNIESRIGGWQPDPDILENGLPAEGRYLLLREAREPNELLELLRFRYRTFHQSRLSGFLPEDHDGIDVDPHDARAWHLGLWLAEAGRLTPVGYLRVVETHDTDARKLLCRLAERHSSIASALAQDPDEVLPVVEYSPDHDILRNRLARYARRGDHIVEASRLAVNCGRGSLSALKLLAESAMAIAFFGSGEVNRAIVACTVTHAAFYRRYGFAHVTGTGDSYWEKPATDACNLEGQPDSIPVSRRARLQELAQTYAWKRFICCPAPDGITAEAINLNAVTVEQTSAVAA